MARTTREYAYRIEGERLHTASVHSTTAPDASATGPRTETDATQVPCP